MPRSYSQQFLLNLHKSDLNFTGHHLAKLCVDACLPAIHVAKVFGVSRMTIHSWFRGSAIRSKKMALIDAFCRVVEKDLASGELPAKSLKEAIVYLEDITKED
jgi:hypothetical protein